MSETQEMYYRETSSNHQVREQGVPHVRKELPGVLVSDPSLDVLCLWGPGRLGGFSGLSFPTWE